VLERPALPFGTRGVVKPNMLISVDFIGVCG
jgi:hypothetical protein